MRQEHRDAAIATPLRLTRADELIDDDLGAVDEIAELSLPNHEHARIRLRVAILESEHRLFREHRIDDLEPRLTLGDMLQRNMHITIILMV